MHNKKILAKGLILGAVVSTSTINSVANYDNTYSSLDINNNLSLLDKNKIRKENKVENSINQLKNKKIINLKNAVLINENIIEGKVYELTLNEGDFVPDNLINNPEGYETIKVITNEGKKLVEEDYINLRESGIPNIDLSGAVSDSIPSGAFNSSIALKEFKFPKGITSIGDEAFMSCYGIVGNLELPDTVASIGARAFYGCSGFTGELKLPNSLTNIGERAFVSCSGFTGNLVIPDSVETIGTSAFTYCDNLDGTLKLSNSLKTIGEGAFMALTGLKGELKLPSSIKSIGDSAFEGCTGFTGDLVIPSSLTSLSTGVFGGCTGFNGALELPDTLETIGFATFNGCSGFKGELRIPNSVKTIGNRAFRDCTGFSGNLVIPNSVETIGSYSFSGCKGLNGELKIGDSVANIETGAFYKCTGLSGELKLPNSITNIGVYAFNECSEFSGNLVIPNSLDTLGHDAFKNVSNIEKIIIASGEEFADINYRKSIIDALDKSKLYIDLPYNFDITGTWLETEVTAKLIKPVLKKIVLGEEVDYDNTPSEQIVLLLETPCKEDDIIVLKDGDSYDLPVKIDGKYVFDKTGNYEITIKTVTGTLSNITFEVDGIIVDENYAKAENAVKKAEESRNPQDIKDARDLVNELLDSIEKQNLINRLDKLEEEIAKEELEKQEKEAQDAVNKAEQTKDSADIEDARDRVNNLPSNSTEKENLADRLDKLEQDILNEAISKAEQAVEKAEESKLSTDISNARDLVNQLPDSTKKVDLTDRLDKLEEENNQNPDNDVIIPNPDSPNTPDNEGSNGDGDNNGTPEEPEMPEGDNGNSQSPSDKPEEVPPTTPEQPDVPEGDDGNNQNPDNDGDNTIIPPNGGNEDDTENGEIPPVDEDINAPSNDIEVTEGKDGYKLVTPKTEKALDIVIKAILRQDASAKIVDVKQDSTCYIYKVKYKKVTKSNSVYGYIDIKVSKEISDKQGLPGIGVEKPNDQNQGSGNNNSSSSNGSSNSNAGDMGSSNNGNINKPQTGDESLYSILIPGLLSIGGLIFVNKKKNEELNNSNNNN